MDRHVSDTGTFGDEGAGPDDPEHVLQEPENLDAARQIRDSTIAELDDEDQGEE